APFCITCNPIRERPALEMKLEGGWDDNLFFLRPARRGHDMTNHAPEEADGRGERERERERERESMRAWWWLADQECALVVGGARLVEDFEGGDVEADRVARARAAVHEVANGDDDLEDALEVARHSDRLDAFRDLQKLHLKTSGGR